MITIFCDFGQYSAKILAFFLKTDVMMHILKNCISLNKKANVLQKNNKKISKP
jgi:hypothetical protein